ncbi:MAG: HD domain-containing protein [Planctomycetes bacterium]|nr:HD domain-containing protein [Planctomycetota bacterium]
MENASGKKNRRILIVDDNEEIHSDFRKILCPPDQEHAALDQAKAAVLGSQETPSELLEGYEIDSAFQGQQGLESIRQSLRENRPYAMAFVDIRMPPGWDGIETIERMWKEYPALQVVICTAHSDYTWQQMIERIGYTDQLLILKKPFDNIEVRQLACAICEKWHLIHNLDEIVRIRTEGIAETRYVAVVALAQLAESRDPETGYHLERIRCFCQILAKQLALEGPYRDQVHKEFIDDLFLSSMLHDIGKVGIPDSILLKPASLTQKEFEIMKEHAAIGADAMDKAAGLTNYGGFLSMAAQIARYHHERFNGTGYPEGLAGQEIPLAARIVALADVYDALMTKRVYKPAFMTEVAKQMIIDERGEHFDPASVDAFLSRYDDILIIPEMLEGKSVELLAPVE